MAQFNYYATWNDDWVFLRELLAVVPVSIILDQWYSDKTLVTYKNLDEDLKDRLMELRRFYLVPDGVSLNTDAGFLKQEGGLRSGWYSIKQDRLGETLDLSLPACYEKDGITCLSSGILTYSQEYLNHELSTWQRPSKSLIALYKLVRRVIQQNLISLTVGQKTEWMGPDAKQLLDSGLAKVMDPGW